ncbi:MAG: hypothetical protein KF805_14125 [Phycisphaeraceae bacterium]|nr:hypothetical protein [Phycisphaeraceae bacterium]
MKTSRAILLAAALASAFLAGCDRGAQIGVGVVNKTGMMMTNCIVRFAEGNLNTGVVLSNARREFSYFDTPISDSATIDVIFPDGAKRNMKAYIGSAYNRDRPGTLVFEIGPEAVRVMFERAK